MNLQNITLSCTMLQIVYQIAVLRDGPLHSYRGLCVIL